MRDLTRAELEDYFSFARSDTRAGDFNRDQVQLIGEIVHEFRFLRPIQEKLGEAYMAGLSPEDGMLSFWVSAFLMGRECESRLLTIALKGKVAQRP